MNGYLNNASKADEAGDAAGGDAYRTLASGVANQALNEGCFVGAG
jgi:hypothetical protein